MNKISEKDLLNLMLEVSVLKRVVRTGWANKGVKDPESVLKKSRAIVKKIVEDVLGVVKAKWTTNAVKFVNAVNNVIDNLKTTVEKVIPVLVAVLTEIEKDTKTEKKPAK